MDIASIVLMFMGMLLFAVVLAPLAQKLHLPYSLVLVLGGFVGSELVTMAGVDLGLRWQHFHQLVFYVFLPALVFESALHMDGRSLWRNLLAILLMSTPMMLLAASITSFLLYYGIGYPAYFPLLAAFLTGALLSATDPAAVLDLFRSSGVSERLILLVDGESLFNDATAIVLFTLLSGLLLMATDTLTADVVLQRFLMIFFGGMLVGCGVSALLGLLYRLFSTPFTRILITLIAAYGSYLLAEAVLHVSGVMAVLVSGLIFGELQRRFADRDNDQLGAVWAFNGELANALIFLLLGVTVTWTMFEQQWLAMLIGIGAILISRAAAMTVFMPLVALLPGEKMGWRHSLVIYWGGVRGAVTVALALSLPLEVESWFTIQSIAYGVVLFTLIVQAPTTPWLIRKLKLAGN
ncbi:cation:proton antiporter [Marinobacterium jannaschii]|uniref:cation:proton antiporter n=1 Tax=Marinobacterium jannaschii TaxID=64970 RepID=UPI000685FAB0|nr:sodium:proton antiporter [Marinobacterium jannaschii]